MFPITARTQDAGMAVPIIQPVEQRPSVPSRGNAIQRQEYFYTRATYPGGTIPEGARVRAWEDMQRGMSYYAPRGRNGVRSDYRWINRGPFTIGGRIMTIAVNPSNPRTIFIGAADGGIWRTFDEGGTWHPVSDDLPTQAMGSIVIDPLDTNVVYAGTGQASFTQRSFDGGGMFKSTDGGSTWHEIGAGTLPPYSRFADIAINPLNPSVLYCAIPDGPRDKNHEGVWKTEDAGATWIKIFEGRTSDLAMNPSDPNILYTVSSQMNVSNTSRVGGMFRSTDGGASWIQLDLGFAADSIGRTSIAICNSEPDILYIGISTFAGDLIGVYKTVDAGDTWRRLHVPFDYLTTQGWKNNIMGVDPTNPNKVFAGGVRMLYSDDGGETWMRIPEEGYGGVLHVDQHSIDFNPLNPDIVYVGNDGGFYVVTNNGSRVEKRDRGLSITQFIGGAMHPTSDELLFGGTQDNGTLMSREKADWWKVLGADGGNAAINPFAPQMMYASQQRISMHRSEDFGRTWTAATVNIPDESSLFYVEYVMDPTNPYTLYLGTYRLYRTTSGGRSWIMMNSCHFPGNSGGCYYISAVSLAEYDSKMVLTGSTDGRIAISQDAGVNWFHVRDSLPDGYCSSVRSFTPGVLYATYTRYGVPKVWRSTTNGATWENLNGNLPDIPVNDILESEGKLIIGSDLGPFISDDGGATWQRFGSGMPTISIQKLRYNAATGTLRAITYGRGMYDLKWIERPSSSPIWSSRPDTSLLEQGQQFIYAPVVTATPSAAFRLLAGPEGASVDSVFGTVRWKARGDRADFVVEAYNASGAATQTFALSVSPPDVAEWIIVSPEAMDSFATKVVHTDDGALWLTRDDGRVSRSTNGGSAWEHYKLPEVKSWFSGIHAFNGSRVLVGSGDGRIFLTSNGGHSWSETMRHIDARFENFHFHDENNGLALTFSRGDSAVMYRTTDGGQTWGAPSAKFGSPYPVSNTLRFFDAHTGLYATYGDNSASTMRTTDGGQNWTRSDAGTRQVTNMAFINPSTGFAVDAFQSRTRRTNSGGQRWLSTFWPMNGTRVAEITVAPGCNHLWVFTDSSAWVSNDEGVTWLRTALVPFGKMQTAVFADSATGWAVSRTGIVQKLRRHPLVSNTHDMAIPHDVQLDAAYPNPLPSGQTLSIPFRLVTRDHVIVNIHNSAGAIVARLTDQLLNAGEHVTSWSADGIPNGTYFVVLTTNSQRSSCSVVVLR
ncbi:MAG: T9SS type A sorting domain-containing protein [Bacteroidia bacterium]|nr:T9SS type A sorting domain-containing protein [Bacteroidia bacterium]